MKCVKGLELKVLKSGAGYYIGTTDTEGFPQCRLSQEYYHTEDAAKDALSTGAFNSRTYAIENKFCYQSCGAKHCFQR